YDPASPRYLHSFPTRRSSDLDAILRKVLPANDQRIGAILEFMSGLREGATELRRSEHAASLNECVSRLEEMNLAEFVEVDFRIRSEEHTSELQSRENLVCRLL